jgi:hypothetical protein
MSSWDRSGRHCLQGLLLHVNDGVHIVRRRRADLNVWSALHVVRIWVRREVVNVGRRGDAGWGIRRLAAKVLLIPHQVAVQTLHSGGLFLTAAGRVEAPVQLLMEVGLEVLRRGLQARLG